MTLFRAGMVLSVICGALPTAGAQPTTPRLLVKISGATGPGQVRATVENLGAVPLAIAIIPRFALRPPGPEGLRRPSFWAPIDLGTAKPLGANGRAILQLAPKGRQMIVVPLESLYWDHYESALWPSRPLRRVVLPGRYNLILEIEDPASGNWWRSNNVSAVVKRAGNLEVAP